MLYEIDVFLMTVIKARYSLLLISLSSGDDSQADVVRLLRVIFRYLIEAIVMTLARFLIYWH